MNQLMDYLTQQAENRSLAAPSLGDLYGRAARRRARRRLMQGAAVASLVTVGALLVPAWMGDDPSAPSAQTTHTASPTEPVDVRHGAVETDGSASCVATYSLATLAERGFAFDGTVKEIATANTSDTISSAGGTVAVTFEVHEWFTPTVNHTTITIQMQPAAPASDGALESYAVGTRLLVSGESQFGDAPRDFIAWGCGFTRYFDEDTAAAWRAAWA